MLFSYLGQDERMR